MGNNFLTSQEIARQALPLLQNNLVMPVLCYTDYSNEFKKKGDTIQVKKPAVFEGKDFDGTIDIQDIDPTPLLVTLNKIADVSVEITAQQMALNLEDFNSEVLEPAMIAIAEKINVDGLKEYKKIANNTGVSGTTPSALDDFANARKILNKNKTPLTERNAVWDPDADAKFSVIPAIVNAEKSGSTQALREGAIGRIQGLNNFMSQVIATHKAGEYTVLSDVKATVDIANNTKDATGRKYSVASLASIAGASTAKLVKGDLLTISGKQYVILEDTSNAVAGVISNAKLYPQLSANIIAVNVSFADVTAGGHVANIAFHKKAIAFVTRPLEKALGVDSYVTSYGGLTLRVTFAYDINTKKQMLSIDTLYSFETLYPELATIVLG